MAVAKRRQSKSRKNMRRAQWMKVAVPAFNVCPHCGDFRLSHRACKSCGKYGAKAKPRQILIIEEPKAKEEQATEGQ